MGLGDLFKATQNKALQDRVVELEALLTPEMRDLLVVQDKIVAATQELNRITTECEKTVLTAQKKADSIAAEADKKLAAANKELRNLEQQIKEARVELIETDETVLMQSFGLYKPRFAFANSTEYKDALAAVRTQQKEMIKKVQQFRVLQHGL